MQLRSNNISFPHFERKFRWTNVNRCYKHGENIVRWIRLIIIIIYYYFFSSRTVFGVWLCHAFALWIFFFFLLVWFIQTQNSRVQIWRVFLPASIKYKAIIAYRSWVIVCQLLILKPAQCLRFEEFFDGFVVFLFLYPTNPPPSSHFAIT